MNTTYSKKLIESKLTSLDQKGQIAFGAACCERMIPNYSAFSQECEWGDVTILRNALDQIWSHIEEKTLLEEKIETLSNLCVKCAPDLDDFRSLLAGHAQNAALSICAVFDYLLTKESERIAQVSAFSVDTVDSHVQEIESMSPSDSDFEKKIRNHPLMEAEINWQFSALTYLNGECTEQEAKSKWSHVISNIGLT